MDYDVSFLYTPRRRLISSGFRLGDGPREVHSPKETRGIFRSITS